ncbi:MAG: hypothetical protein ABL921_15385 [Pirellula sp.]
MNCLAHAYRFLADPYFAAGTCLPDWLGMVDRKVRVRRKEIDIVIADPTHDSISQLVARGIQQHLRDDNLFHNSVPFHSTSSSIAKLIQDQCEYESHHLPGFVGHILVELLLDASIENNQPGTLDLYYESIEQVCAVTLQHAVNAMANQATQNLTLFVDRYMNDKFLFDYLSNDRLLMRLNGVLRRTRLAPLTPSFVSIIEQAREIVDHSRQNLLESVH